MNYLTSVCDYLGYEGISTHGFRKWYATEIYRNSGYDDYSDAILPEGIESVHPHYAISWRNNWMLRESEYVVTYITHTWGGADQYAKKARRQKKVVIRL